MRTVLSIVARQLRPCGWISTPALASGMLTLPWAPRSARSSSASLAFVRPTIGRSRVLICCCACGCAGACAAAGSDSAIIVNANAANPARRRRTAIDANVIGVLSPSALFVRTAASPRATRTSGRDWHWPAGLRSSGRDSCPGGLPCSPRSGAELTIRITTTTANSAHPISFCVPLIRSPLQSFPLRCPAAGLLGRRAIPGPPSGTQSCVTCPRDTPSPSPTHPIHSRG